MSNTNTQKTTVTSLSLLREASDLIGRYGAIELELDAKKQLKQQMFLHLDIMQHLKNAQGGVA